MKKRILSLLLALVLTTTSLLFPTTATAKPMKLPEAAESKYFDDIPDNAWYKTGVDYCSSRNFMSGVSDALFDPDSSTTRAMIASVLYRIEGSPDTSVELPFEDVKISWYTDAVAWAYEKGIMMGVSSNLFSPESEATREQLAVIIYRYSMYRGCDVTNTAEFSSFADASKVSQWAGESLKWAYGEELIVGSTQNGRSYLDPQGVATRAQLASILQRFLEKYITQIFTRNILFVGNSYTYYNDMPTALFASVSGEAGYLFNVTMITKAHGTLEEAIDPKTETGGRVAAALAKTKFDYAIIQEQSVRPFTAPNRFYRAARVMIEMVRENGATPLFYCTWGRKAGHEILDQYGVTTEEMAMNVAASYKILGAELGVEVVYVGLAFLDIHTSHGDTIDLYNKDLTHPSYIGSYLAAVTIFTKLTGEDPTTLTYFGELPEDVTALLFEAARKAVFETPEVPDVVPEVTEKPATTEPESSEPDESTTPDSSSASDSSEPSESTDPTESTDTDESTDPTESSEPDGSEESSDPAEITDPSPIV